MFHHENDPRVTALDPRSASERGAAQRPSYPQQRPPILRKPPPLVSAARPKRAFGRVGAAPKRFAASFTLERRRRRRAPRLVEALGEAAALN
jgi:hypothetical protein